MADKRKVSIKNTVFNFLDNTGIQDHKMQPLLTRWAVDADYAIGSYYSYQRKVQVISHIDGCSAEIPCGVIDVKGLILGDCGCDCGVMFDGLYKRFGGLLANVAAGIGFIVIDGGSGTRRSTLGWHMQGGNLIFNAHYTGAVTIDTLAYQYDAEGFPLVNWNHLTAITAYLEWMLAKRTRWNKNFGSITETGIRELFRDWTRMCAEARADSEDLSEADRDQIREDINNPMTGGETGVWPY